MSYFENDLRQSPNSNIASKNLNNKHIPHSHRYINSLNYIYSEKIGLHSFYFKDSIGAKNNQIDLNIEKNKSDNQAKCKFIYLLIIVYATIFKNPQDGLAKKFNNIQTNPQKESSFSSSNLKNLNPIYKMSSIYDPKSTQRQDRQELSEQKFKTLYGFNMNKSINPQNNHNIPNYHYKKNFIKENRSISPNQKLVEGSQQILSSNDKENILSKHILHYFIYKESRSHNHANLVSKYTPQQPTQRLPNLILQDNKPELKKFSTTYSNEFNINNGNKKNPIPEAVSQEKLANKNHFFNKLNEMTTTLMNNNIKLKIAPPEVKVNNLIDIKGLN